MWRHLVRILGFQLPTACGQNTVFCLASGCAPISWSGSTWVNRACGRGWNGCPSLARDAVEEEGGRTPESLSYFRFVTLFLFCDVPCPHIHTPGFSFSFHPPPTPHRTYRTVRHPLAWQGDIINVAFSVRHVRTLSLDHFISHFNHRFKTWSWQACVIYADKLTLLFSNFNPIRHGLHNGYFL